MILVLNAGGNIGKELVRVLKSRSADFAAAYRSADDARAAEAAGTKAVIADYAKPETLRAALAGIDKVFFVTPPALNLEELEGNVVEAAKVSGVTRLVKLSVWGADTGGFIFARAHQAVEQRVEASGIPYTFLRPTGFMQNMLGNAQTIKSQGAYYLPAGDAKVAEIDYRDIAEVAASALIEDGHAGKAYELSGPEAMTHAERAQVLSDVLGKPIKYISSPPGEWKAMMTGYGVPAWQVDGILDLLDYYKDGKSQRISPAVEQVAGAKPRSYRQFAQDYAGVFR